MDSINVSRTLVEFFFFVSADGNVSKKPIESILKKNSMKNY